MLCYRDRTYCPFYADCADAKDCSRPLTDEVREAAIRVDLPVSQFVDKPNCHVAIEPTEVLESLEDA